MEDNVQTLPADSPETQAQDTAGPQADPAQQAAIEASLGSVFLALGPPAQAQEHLTRALALAKQAADRALAAAVLTNLGNLHASQGAYAEATRAYTESADLAEQAEARGLAARACANAARAALIGGSPPP